MSPSAHAPTNPGPALNILISGIGIAGPLTAYWLLRGNPKHRITLVERSPKPRYTGQQIDIRHAGVTIIRKMNLESTIKQACTEVDGFEFVSPRGKVHSRIRMTGDVERQGLVSEFEVFRGRLVEILFGKVESRVQIVSGEYVTKLEQVDCGVRAFFDNGRGAETYDLVLGCDGTNSKIRGMMLDVPSREQIESTCLFTAHFSMPTAVISKEPGQRFGRKLTSDRGRTFFLGPHYLDDQTSVGFMRVTPRGDMVEYEKHRKILDQGQDAYRKFLVDDYGDMSDQPGAKEMLNALKKDELGEFYASEGVKINCARFTNAERKAVQDEDSVDGKGNIALIGDAGYGCTLTGLGTTMALVGGYVLAGEITKALRRTAQVNKESGTVLDATTKATAVSGGLKGYEDIMRPYVKKVCKIPTGLPHLFFPQSMLGVWLFDIVARVIIGSGLLEMIFKLMGSEATSESSFKLPEYTWDDSIRE